MRAQIAACQRLVAELIGVSDQVCRARLQAGGANAPWRRPKKLCAQEFARAVEAEFERFVGPDRAGPAPAAPQLAMPAVPPRPAPRCSAYPRCGAPPAIAATAAKAAARAAGSSDLAGVTAGPLPASPTSAPLPAGAPCDASPPSARVQSDPLFRLAGAGGRGPTAALDAERTVCRPMETSQRAV